LADLGLIQIRKNGFPGGISYYQLSRKSAKELAFPSHRARAPGDMALPRDLAILWFCCISETRCCRLEQVHLERLVGEPLQGDYCMETQDAHRLFQLHVVGANSDPSYCIKAIVKDMDQVDFCPELHLRFQRRHYGYVILVSSEGQRVATQRLLKPDKLKDRAKIVVSVVPTPSTLKESIKDSPKR